MTIEFWQAAVLTMLVSGVILNLYIKLLELRHKLQTLELGLEYLERRLIRLQSEVEYRKEGKEDSE